MDWIADQTRLTRQEHLYPPEQGGELLSWKYSREHSPGGKLIFHGTHYIDALQWLVGDTITDVAALTANVGGSAIENEDAACVSFRMGRSGLMGYVHYTGTRAQPTAHSREDWQPRPLLYIERFAPAVLAESFF